jgi:hypothetical protein
MDLSGVLQDARMENIPDFINIRTEAAKDTFKDGLQKWSSDPAVLRKRTETILQLRASLADQPAVRDKMASSFEKIAEHESTLRSFWQPPSSMEEEGYSQLLFRGEYTKPLNQLPSLLNIWSTLKIFVFPAMTISTPLLTLIAPFIIVKFMMKIPLTTKQYFKILQGMYLGGGMSKLFSSIPEMPALPVSLSDQARIWLQTGWVIISTIQSIMSPINGAKHTHKLRALIFEKARAIREYVDAVRALREQFAALGIKTARTGVPTEILEDNARLVAYALENSAVLRILDRSVGHYELWYRFAVSPEISAAHWVTRERPFIRFEGICDIGIHTEKQRKFAAVLGGAKGSHALLTGPNRGGKSTALRAVLRNILLAHCFGVGMGTRIELTAFDWIQSCLRLEDLPGKASLFEREVAFAAASLARPANKRGFVFVDELFHSTNPPDAAAASAHYLQKLWAEPQVISMISTHVFEIVESAPAGIQRLCCPAEMRADGSVNYKYGLARGICKVSSVGEIMREQGLGFAPAPGIALVSASAHDKKLLRAS